MSPSIGWGVGARGRVIQAELTRFAGVHVLVVDDLDWSLLVVQTVGAGAVIRTW
ncbi:hypothetical protein D3C85_1734150 [compost metagenome]